MWRGCNNFAGQRKYLCVCVCVRWGGGGGWGVGISFKIVFGLQIYRIWNLCKKVYAQPQISCYGICCFLFYFPDLDLLWHL